MNNKRSNSIFLILLVMGFSVAFLSSCNKKSMEGVIVFTQVKGGLQKINYNNGDSWRYLSEARIVTLNPKDSKENIKVLTKDYFSACAPEISYDGKFLLFAAQKKQNDIWQIWEMNLENLKVKQITSSTENCMDPAYLPGGHLVFSKFTENDTIITGHSLFTANLHGSDMSEISVNGHRYFKCTVLQDGRILTISKQLYPDEKDGMYMILRPDGTKQELFYQPLKGSKILSRGRETKEGKVYFVESDNTGGNIIAVNYNRPLHSRVDLSSGMEGDFHSVSPLEKGILLVSYRASDKDSFALYEFDEDSKKLGKEIYKDKNYSILDAIVVKKKERPKKLPSELKMDKHTALLLCMDVNFTDLQMVEDSSSTSKATSVEVMGMNESLGIIDVEKDGSFYLKVLADIPFRIQTIDKDGQVVNGPGSWLYLRPNERRGCVGCHEDHEQVPENRQPLSVKKEPMVLPKQIDIIRKGNISSK